MHLRTPVKGSVRLATGMALLTKLLVLVADISVQRISASASGSMPPSYYLVPM